MMQRSSTASRRHAGLASPAAAPAGAARMAEPPLSRMQRTAGNRATNAFVQQGRTGGGSDAALEREAARVSAGILRPDHPMAPLAAPSGRAGGRAAPGGGRPLPGPVRDFFEPRLGADLGGVRIHTGAAAERQARGLGARAYTTGADVVFGRGEYAPQTAGGRQLLAHELTHVVQQTHGPAPQGPARTDEGASPVRERSSTPRVSRVDASMCSSDCAAPDGTGTATGKFSITAYADKEGMFLLMPLTSKVGHSWVRLEDDKGRYWTYGFWPKEGFDSSNPRADVDGCIHHPDTAHTPTSSQTWEVTATEFAAAMAVATTTCATAPKYNLFGLQCTSFAKNVLQAAGKNTGGFGLIWESPNALDSWIKTHSLVLGVAGTAAGPGGHQGNFSFNATYTHQFASVLGNRLRFFGTGQLELGKHIQTFAPGAGVELNPGIVWIPVPYAAGLVPLGNLGGHLGQEKDGEPLGPRFGAGLGAAAGVRFNIDEIAVIGVEWNVMKDFVNEDPALHRLMIGAGIRFW